MKKREEFVLQQHPKWAIAAIGLFGLAAAAVFAIAVTSPEKVDYIHCPPTVEVPVKECYVVLKGEGMTVQVPCPRSDSGVM